MNYSKHKGEESNFSSSEFNEKIQHKFVVKHKLEF